MILWLIYNTTEQLLEAVRQGSNTFSVAQKKVARYVLHNYHQIPFLSITSLSKNIGVSENSVIKFCNQLGFARFAQFKKAFAANAHSELVMSNKLIKTADDTSEDLFEKGMTEDMSAIAATLSDASNRENLPLLLDMIDRASNIYVTGGRGSGALAAILSNALRYFDLNVHELTSGVGDYWDRVSAIKKNDLVIAISLPRYTAEVVSALKHLHTNGISIALITDTGLSPAHPYSNIAFHCSVSSDYYYPCFSGCMSLISVICRAVGAARKDTAAEHILALESKLLSQGVFI